MHTHAHVTSVLYIDEKIGFAVSMHAWVIPDENSAKLKQLKFYISHQSMKIAAI